MIDEVMRQEQIPAAPLSGSLENIREDTEFLNRRLNRLEKLQLLLKGKYHKRLEALLDQVNNINNQQGELKSLAKQLKKNKEKRAILKNQVANLERRKKTLQETIKQVAGYEKSSNRHIEAIEEEQQVLCQRIQDLMQALELAEESGLNGIEIDIIHQRFCATKGLLEEHERDLRKRTIDLLFEFYIPPKNGRFMR